MADDPGSKDKSLESLDFLINVLKEHESKLDQSLDQLATVMEQMPDADTLNGKLEKFEEKLISLQSDVSNLISKATNLSKETSGSVSQRKQDSEIQASVAMDQNELPVTLTCKEWVDFQTLAMNSNIISFSYSENEKIFRVNAIKGRQMISYAGVLNLSTILKLSLSKLLDSPDGLIFEGTFDNGKKLEIT